MTHEQVLELMKEYSAEKQARVQHITELIAKLTLEDALYLMHIINQDLVFWQAQRSFNQKKMTQDVKEPI
jgi:hypothetical protein